MKRNRSTLIWQIVNVKQLECTSVVDFINIFFMALGRQAQIEGKRENGEL